MDAQPAGGAPPPPPGFVMDQPAAPEHQTPTAQQATAGFNEGLASTVVRALDAPGYFLGKALGTEVPEEQRHPFEGAFRRAFVDPAGAPTTPMGHVLRAGGNMAGENVENFVPVSAVAGSGARAGVTMAEQAAPGITNKLRGAADAVLEWMAEHPTKAALSDNVAAFESGAGGEIGHRVAEDQGASPTVQEGARVAGQLLAPSGIAAYSKYAPTALTIKAAPIVAKKGLQMLPEAALPESMRPAGGSFAEREADRSAFANREGKYADPSVPAPAEPNWVTRQMDAGAKARQEKAAATVAGDMKTIAARPEAAANLAEAEAIKKDIPGFNPGVAKASGDPALLNLQQRLESEATNDELRRVQQNVDASRGAIAQHLEQAFPLPEQPRKSPDFVGPMPASETPQDIVSKAVTSRVGETGKAIETEKAGLQKQLSDQAASLPEVDRIAAGANLRESRDAAQRAMDARTNELRGKIGNPDAPIDVNGEPSTVGAALDRRAAINQEMRDYTNATARTVDDVKRMRALQAERENIDAAIDKASANDGALKAYTDQYRTENVPQFRQGASAEVGRKDSFGYGGYKVDPEKVGAKFFNPNEESAAAQFEKAMGHDPGARQQMVDNALDDIRHNGIDPNTHAIKPGFIQKWLTKNERVLKQMPQTGAEIRAAVQAKDPDALYARIGELEKRQRAVADTKVAGLLGKNPEQQIDAALNDWQIARSLKRSVAGDPNGEAALARAVMNKAPDPMSPQFGQWVEGHKRVLSEVLTPQHLANIQTVTKAAAIENRLPRPTGSTEMPKSSVDKAGETVGLPIKSVLQRFMAVAQGRVGAKYTAMDIGTRMLHAFTGREIDAVWREALFNPKIAQDVSTIVRSKGATGLQLNRLHNYLLTVGEQDTKADHGK